MNDAMTPRALPNTMPRPRLETRRLQDSTVLTFVTCVTIFLLAYFFSIWLLEIYAAGDQQHYRAFWTAMTWAKPAHWQLIQTRYLGSNDYLYSAIIAFGTVNGFDRIVYISLWNAGLVAALGYVLLKCRASLIFGVFLLTNYYVLVLLFSAERVKFAYIFLTLALCVDKPRLKLAFAILSAFCHTQAIVQFASSAIYTLTSNYKQIFAKKKTAVFVVAIAPFLVAGAGYLIFMFAGEVLLDKSEFYASESQGVLEVIQWGLILGAGIVVFTNRIPFFLSMLPLGALTFMFGNRINIATLALFLTLALAQRKTSHPLVLAVMAYMSFKSVDFVTRVLATGQGFL